MATIKERVLKGYDRICLGSRQWNHAYMATSNTVSQENSGRLLIAVDNTQATLTNIADEGDAGAHAEYTFMLAEDGRLLNVVVSASNSLIGVGAGGGNSALRLNVGEGKSGDYIKVRGHGVSAGTGNAYYVVEAQGPWFNVA